MRRSCAILMAILICGCKSPEDGRPRDGGAGADGGNYKSKPLHAPSKIDASKHVPELTR